MSSRLTDNATLMLPQSFLKTAPTIGLTVALAASLASRACCSAIDLDGDGLSDVWQAAFDAQGIDPAGDSDGDGFTNLEECEHGTDPWDAASKFEFLGFEADPEGVAFRFRGAERQSYYLEVSEDLAHWGASDDVLISDGGEDRLVATGEQKIRFLRFRVGADQDRDGLTDFEEALLGYDPHARHTDPSFSGGDLARLVSALSSDTAVPVGDGFMRGQAPTLASASRFLMQASLGATMEDIEEVAAMGFDAWIDAEVEKEPAAMEPEIDARIAQELDTFNHHRHYAWWNQVMTSDDALRQRMAMALSEIYVVSDQVIDGRAATEGIANYYDMLGRSAFGNWRELLRDVSLHPVMGLYLSHMQNRKADPELNRYPDENYAREVMQLFSIGIFELNPDGTRKLDASGAFVPTYDNADITNFARVFTGLSFGGQQRSQGQPAQPKNTEDWTQFFWGTWDYDDPMLFWPAQHDTAAKTLLRGTELPAFADDPGRAPIDDFEDAIDNLYRHPNVGPFVTHRLIQRLVTSNPTPGYIERVAGVFADNGQGERGDLSAVVKAILLDPEARSLAALEDPHAGRLREPFLRWVRLVKAFRPAELNGGFPIPDWSAMDELEQKPLSSRSVFNFFMPDYVPEGEMAEAGLVGPEFQILTATTSMASQNYWGTSMMWGFAWSEGDKMSFGFEEEVSLLAAGDLEGLIDRIDLLLTYGQLSEETRQVLREAYASRQGWIDDRASVAILARLVMLSPEFAIFR